MRVYEALEPLTCSECRRPMIPSERFVDQEDDREDIGIAATGNRPLPWRPRPESIQHASQAQLWRLWNRLRGIPTD